MDKVKLKKLSGILRLVIIILLLLVFSLLCVTRLTKIQLVDGDLYLAQSQKSYTATQLVQAARGQIADVNGVPLNSNETVYKVIVQKAFFPRGSENEIIANAVTLLAAYGEGWIDTMPITKTKPFRFTDVSDEALDLFKENIKLNPDATVENCLDRLIETYNVDEKYDDEMIRSIVGVRYEMKLRDFSQNNRYTFAEDIKKETVIAVRENSQNLAGIDIVVEPMRVYDDGDLAAHIRGTIGAISADQYTELKEQGYSLNDKIGQTGIEKAMEGVLRGVNGVRTITRDSNGMAVSDEITSQVKPGNSIKLTIDTDFQNTLQEIVVNHINWVHNIEKTESVEKWQRGQNTEGMAVVVLDAKSGAVLGMVSYPFYDLNDYIDNYYSVLTAELNPLFNRATSGLYRPGSTFKTITGTSGLQNHIIGKTDTVVCNHVYTFYPDYQPKCTGTDGAVSITQALKVSCNIFFYDVGRRLGISNIADTAKHFGIGTNLGLEIDGGGAAGRMTTAETYNQIMEKPFTDGDVLQAAIGQSETLVTPMHLAVQALTLANNGVRYKPYLVDSVWNYDMTELIYKTEPEIVDELCQDQPEIFETVREGMIAVSEMVYWPPHDMSKWCYDYLPEGNYVASKTGTPQSSLEIFNSTITGYYPANDPQIAFGIVAENSDWTRYMVRNIIDAYFYDAYEPDFNEDGIIQSPWKRWDAEKIARLTPNNDVA